MTTAIQRKSGRSSTIFSRGQQQQQQVWLLLLFTLVVCMPSVVEGQFCRRLDNTWSGFVDTVKTVEESSSGYALLCPFEISGDDCPTVDEFPGGYNINANSSLILICDPDLFGYNSDTDCTINCPGVHFTVGDSASLTLDGVTLAGATDSAIQVEERATLRIINSVFRDNVAQNEKSGGAIRAQPYSMVNVEYSTFTNNRAFEGGAIYSFSESIRILQTTFTDNFAQVAGGAIANGPFRVIDIQRSSFHGNSAASGGALYLQDYSEASILSNTFVGNYAIDGGAIYNSAISSFVELVFQDNYAENAGGAITSEPGSVTSIHRSQFINNGSGHEGPAVYDRFNTRIEKAGNTACGNIVESRNSECDGIFVRISRRRVRCLPFEGTCIAPTQSPSTSPSENPTEALSEQPTQLPSNAPTDTPSLRPSMSIKPSQMPTSPPSHTPSDVPSSTPTISPSEIPSSQPTTSAKPSTSIEPSQTPTDEPSSTPSMVPSNVPSELPSFSGIPSLQPSEMPSGAPSTSQSPSLSVSPSEYPSESPSETPSSSAAPSEYPTQQPSDNPSYMPSDMPSSMPSFPASVPSSNVSDSPPGGRLRRANRAR